MVKAEKEHNIKTLESLVSLCNRLTEIEEEELRIQILMKCQEAAIVFGENLESYTNRIDVEAIKESAIIKKLEEFCERAFVCSQDFSLYNIVALKSQITEISVLLENIPRTYRVAFLPYKASMWDSLESIWKCFAMDERCETSVVPIPYFEANSVLNEWEMRYEGNQYPNDVPVINFQEYLLEEKRPDIVFVHNPFDQHNFVTTVHPAYYSEELKKHCGKLVYVPYFVNPGFVSDNYNMLPLLYRADYLVLQSERMKETCKEFPYYDRVLPFGSPKFDKVILMEREGIEPPSEWNMDLTGKKRLLLNTTVADFLEYGENLILKLKHFFEKALKQKNLAIIWRPHPLLEGTIKAMRPQLLDKYQELMNFFKDNQVGVLDSTADVSRAVVVSDAYIGSEYSSIIALFEVLNKPVFKFDSKEIHDSSMVSDRVRIKAEQAFKMQGEFDFFGCHESDEYMFEDFVDDLINERFGEVLVRQAVEESGISNNLDGTCGEKVHDYIMNHM